MDKANLNMLLSFQARQQGIEFRQSQDDFLELWIKGWLLAYYSQTEVGGDNILRDIEANQFGKN